MDNQHRQIKGYRELSQEEIDLMNKVKTKAAEVSELIKELANMGQIDKRWLAIGTTDLQTGFMAITRSIARPEFF